MGFHFYSVTQSLLLKEKIPTYNTRTLCGSAILASCRPVKKTDYKHGLSSKPLNSWRRCPIIKIHSVRDQFSHQQKPQQFAVKLQILDTGGTTGLSFQAELRTTRLQRFSPSSGKCLESVNEIDTSSWWENISSRLLLEYSGHRYIFLLFFFNEEWIKRWIFLFLIRGIFYSWASSAGVSEKNSPPFSFQ